MTRGVYRAQLLICFEFHSPVVVVAGFRLILARSLLGGLLGPLGPSQEVHKATRVKCKERVFFLESGTFERSKTQVGVGSPPCWTPTGLFASIPRPCTALHEVTVGPLNYPAAAVGASN